jgi:hypothetical protein
MQTSERLAALVSLKTQYGLEDADITAVMLHSHPVYSNGVIDGSFSMLQVNGPGLVKTGDLLNFAGSSLLDATIVTSEESGPQSTGGQDALRRPQYEPGSVLAVFTGSWKQTPPQHREDALYYREISDRDPLKSGTNSTEIRQLGDWGVTQSQARAGYPDRYVLYVASAIGDYHRVRYPLPAGYRR